MIAWVLACTKADETSSPETGSGPSNPQAAFEASFGLESIVVLPGVFSMGSPAEELGRNEAMEQLHEVTLTRAFTLTETEVTQAAWERITGGNPSLFGSCGPDCPVERVSWTMAAVFANGVSEAAGLAPCFVCDVDACAPTGDPYTCEGYRLPTEAEWEMAARGGTSSAFSDGGDLVAVPTCDDASTPLTNGATLEALAWHCANSGGTTHPVGQKVPNPLGFYDIHGNVYEWVFDASAPYLGVAEVDPIGPPAAADKVARGGCWEFEQTSTRSANRHAFPVDGDGDLLGLRLARTLDP